MADGIDEISAIKCVEVNVPDALIDKVHHLLGCDRCRNELRGCRIVIEAFEAPGKPSRHRCAGLGAKARNLLEVVDWHDPRMDRTPDAGPARFLDEAQIMGVVEEELRDDARSAGIGSGGGGAGDDGSGVPGSSTIPPPSR